MRPPVKVDLTYHTFKIIDRFTALCGCGFAYLGGDTLEEKSIRHRCHIGEVERYLTEQMEQRAAEAAEYGDPNDLYNRTDRQRAEQSTNKKRKRGY